METRTELKQVYDFVAALEVAHHKYHGSYGEGYRDCADLILQKIEEILEARFK